MPQNQTVKFNVGGRIFEVLREPTLALHPESLLSQLAHDTDPEDTEPIFVEANPDLFQFMLDFHRYRKIHISFATSREAVLREAALLGLPVGTGQVVQEMPPLGALQECLTEVTAAAEQHDSVLKDSILAAKTQLLAETIKAVVAQRVRRREVCEFFFGKGVSVCFSYSYCSFEDIMANVTPGIFDSSKELYRKFLLSLAHGIKKEQLEEVLKPWAVQQGYKMKFDKMDMEKYPYAFDLYFLR